MDVFDLTVSDDVQGFVCDIASLAAGASTTCSLNGTAGFGLYENLGSAAGTYTDGSGNEAPLNADDPSSYLGARPAISIVKLTNGQDGSESSKVPLLSGPTRSATTATWMSLT